MPHLGVSTEEAKNEAAAHGTEFDLKDCLEDGTICNSVNYSATSLPDHPSGSIHLTVVNRNAPGILAKIRDTVTKSTLDIVQQVNHSHGEMHTMSWMLIRLGMVVMIFHLRRCRGVFHQNLIWYARSGYA